MCYDDASAGHDEMKIEMFAEKDDYRSQSIPKLLLERGYSYSFTCRLSS
jgi:hypothetical protein